MKGLFSKKRQGSSPDASSLAKAKLPLEKVPDTVVSAEGLAGGSIERCIEYTFCCSTEKGVFALLYCFRSFASPTELLEHLKKMVGDPKLLLVWRKDFSESDVRSRMAKILLSWISIAFFDLQHDPKLVASLHSLLETLLPPAEHNRVKLCLLKSKVEPHNLVFPEEPTDIKNCADQLRVGGKYLLQNDPESIAHELTIIDFDLYKGIEASELLNKNWQRENSAELSPNLVALRKRFNQLSFWVVSIILDSTDLKVVQVKLVKLFLDIAWVLYQTRNYNSMGAIVSALNSVSLTRLPYLWDHLSKVEAKKRDELNNILEVTQNFKMYRHLLEVAGLEKTPCIPYIPMHLRDMLTIYEREENYLSATDAAGKPMVNFAKMQALGLIMHQLLQFRTIPWKPSVDAAMRDFLVRVPYLSDDDLLQSSDQWKALEGERLIAKSPVASMNIKARLLDGHVLISLLFDGAAVLFPFDPSHSMKDFKKMVRHITTKDYDLRFLVDNGVSLWMMTVEDWSCFLSSSPTLMVEAGVQQPRAAKLSVARTNRSFSGTKTLRVRPHSTNNSANSLDMRYRASTVDASSEALFPATPPLQKERRGSMDSLDLTSLPSVVGSLAPPETQSQPASPRTPRSRGSPLVPSSFTSSPVSSPRGDGGKHFLPIDLSEICDGAVVEGSQCRINVPRDPSFAQVRVVLELLLDSRVQLKLTAEGAVVDDHVWQRAKLSSPLSLFVEKVKPV